MLKLKLLRKLLHCCLNARHSVILADGNERHFHPRVTSPEAVSEISLSPRAHAHAHAHTRTRAHGHTGTRAHAHTGTRAHARTRARTHTHTHTRCGKKRNRIEFITHFLPLRWRRGGCGIDMRSPCPLKFHSYVAVSLAVTVLEADRKSELSCVFFHYIHGLEPGSFGRRLDFRKEKEVAW